MIYFNSNAQPLLGKEGAYFALDIFNAPVSELPKNPEGGFQFYETAEGPVICARFHFGKEKYIYANGKDVLYQITGTYGDVDNFVIKKPKPVENIRCINPA